MRNVAIGTCSFSIPASWDELSTQELESIALISLSSSTRVALKLRVMLRILKLKVLRLHRNELGERSGFYLVRRGLNIFSLSPSQLNFIASCLDFLFVENHIVSKRIINPYPVINFGAVLKKRFFGPDSGLCNLSLGEWILAEVERTAYEETKDDKHLFRFLAILWRPTCRNHPDGDPRSPLRQDTLSKRALFLKRKLPAHRVRVMLWWYYGCLSYIQSRFASVLAPDGGSNASSASNVFDNFLRLVNGLANNDLAKNDAIRQSPLYDALYNLQIIIELQNKTKKHGSETL